MLDINAIVQETLKKMDEEKTIETLISTTIEKSISTAIKDQFGSYQFREMIEKKLKNEVDGVVASLDFTAYNGYIAKTMSYLIEDVASEDLQSKILFELSKIFIKKDEMIKLIDIFDAYTEWQNETTDESDKWEKDTFTADYREIKGHSSYFHYIECWMSDDNTDGVNNSDIRFRIRLNNNDDAMGVISELYIDGEEKTSLAHFSALTVVEKMLLTAYFNQTPIFVEGIDFICNSYNIDR